MNNLVTIRKRTEKAIQRIEGSWSKSVEYILQTSTLLLEYQQRGDWIDIKKELISRDIMKSSVISMLMSIGQNSLLQSKENLNLLPKAYNTLYHLSLLEKDDLSNHFESGNITPALTLKQAKDYRPGSPGKPRPPSKNKSIVNISIRAEHYGAHKAEIDKLLSEISSKYPYLVLSRAK